MKQYYEILEDMGLQHFNYTPRYESPSYKNEDIVLSRILYAIEQNERIFVYGDYDVDGLCCLLAWKDFFESISYENVDFYRYVKRTHQIDSLALYQYITGSYDLMIVCDAGSNSLKDILDLKDRQKDVVILDHHKSDYDYEEYPNNCYIVNSFSDGYVMSAGALVYTIIEKLYRMLDVSEKPGIVLYGLLSMYSDCMDMSSDFGRGLYFKVMDVSKSDYPLLITDFMLEYSALSRRAMEYQISPKINAVFRSENFSVLNDYIFSRTDINVGFIKEKITSAWSESRKEIQKIADYIEVTVMRSFVIANLDTVESDIKSIPRKTLQNYTGLLANILSAKYGKTCLVFCSDSSVAYKISLRDFLSRNYLEVFKLFSDANGHPSAFGIYLDKGELSEFMYYLDLVDKGEYVTEMKNEPYIVNVDTPVVPPTLVSDIALFNEFSGSKIPLLLLQKAVTKKLPRRDSAYGDYRYTWGETMIKSNSEISIGTSILLKPYIANKPMMEVEAQKML